MDAEERRRFNQALVTNGRADGFELKLLRKDGTSFDARVWARLVCNERGEKQRVDGIIADVTEIKQAEEERRKMEARILEGQKLESLGVLAGGIAHVFNNLLTGIIGYSDLALDGLPPDSAAHSAIEEVRKAAKRAAAVSRQILAYTGRERLAVEQVDLSETALAMAHLLEAIILEQSRLEFRLADHMPLVNTDVSQVRQTILSLVTNASEAIGEKEGVITITTGVQFLDSAYLTGREADGPLPAGVYVYLEVADNGCGMDEDTCKKVFDPFFTTKFMGRGLGLAAVSGIVRAHKGGIRVESESGRGAKFRVFLPACDQVAASQEKLATRTANGDRGNESEEKRRVSSRPVGR